MFRILNTLKKTLAAEPEKEQFVNFKRNSIKKVSLADIFLKLMQKNGKDVEIKRINKLEYVYEKLTGYYFLISSEKVADYYDYNIKIFHKKLFPNGVIEKTVRFATKRHSQRYRCGSHFQWQRSAFRKTDSRQGQPRWFESWRCSHRSKRFDRPVDTSPYTKRGNRADLKRTKHCPRSRQPHR